MTDDRKAEDGALAPWFEAARTEAPLPDGDWLARMEAMALAEQPAPRPEAEPAPARGRRRFGGLGDLLSGLGGWPAMTGLAAACAAGVWIGAVSPEALTAWMPSSGSSDSVLSLDPASGFDFAMVGL